MEIISHNIAQEELTTDRENLRQSKISEIRKEYANIDKLYIIKNDYIRNNYNKHKEELLIINEVLDDFINYIMCK